MANQLENLVESIKSKVRALKKSKKKPYIKMDKSSSVKIEIRSKQARKLIDKTLKAADRPEANIWHTLPTSAEVIMLGLRGCPQGRELSRHCHVD
ncbi:unnamed protein product [Ilex paraguariensis]|uniref:Uncharacterized protein n=1 Tax=Ilex paraguariensis TaxID=185542 RepID=A0ABC8R7B2_9AQUA